MAVPKPTLIVADASVLAQWVLPGEDACPGVTRLIDDVLSEAVVLLVPSLFYSEISSILSVSVRRRRIDPIEADLGWQAIEGLNIVCSNRDATDPEITRLSLLAGISAYDASYVALAERHRCPFYTADRRLMEAMRDYSDLVRPIDEYPSRESGQDSVLD